MPLRLNEDRAYDRAASNLLVAAIVAETEMDTSDDYVFIHRMFYKVVYQKLSVPGFWVLPE